MVITGPRGPRRIDLHSAHDILLHVSLLWWVLNGVTHHAVWHDTLQESSHYTPVNGGQMTGVMLIGPLRQAGMTKQASDELAVATSTLAIGGLTCGTCERHVLRALDGVRGVIHAAVDLEHAQATVEHLPALVDAIALVTAVRDAGYEARVIQTTLDTDAVAPRQASGATCGCGCCGRSDRARDWANLGTSTIG